MTTRKSRPAPIDIIEGVEPSTDATKFKTQHWTASTAIRFVDGKPRKIKGNSAITFDSGNTISGKCRNIFSALVNGKGYTLLGTNSKLYVLIGSTLTNITPLQTSTTAIANSLDTDYATLGTDPLTTTSGSETVTIADTGAEGKYVAGDSYTLSGFSGAQNGIPDTELNAEHIIRSVSTDTVTISVTTTATSSGSTGGASIVRATGLITVNATSHGQANGDRCKLASAADTGGVTAAQINIEHIIRNVDTNTFDVMTTGTATSSVSSGGGASTTYQVEISGGAADETFGQGYGLGLYGTGLYGVSKTATGVSSKVYPRIWFYDRFGDLLIGTPTDSAGLYQWDGNTAIAPTLVSNAPTSLTYCFVSNNIAVVLGADGVENRIKSSDINGLTTWTATAENQAFADDIEGAGQFISHLNVNGTNLIFTENQTYTLDYVGKPAIWDIEKLDLDAGIIAPNARKEVNGVGYWMGTDNFYMWRGGKVEVIPSNTTNQSTILNYVFDDLNFSQKSKCFVEYVVKYNELRFHYPSANSNECDRVACVNLHSFAWWYDTSDRIAAEYPNTIFALHRMVDGNGVLYNHETTNNDNGSALSFSLTSPLRYSGKETAMMAGLIPDSILTGNITVTLNTYKYPQSSTAIGTQSMTVSSTTELIPSKENGRYWDYTISGSATGQDFIMGDWQEEIQESFTQ